MSLKAPHASDFLDPAKEQEAVENAALSLAAVMEGTAMLWTTVEKLGFSEDVREGFRKNIKRALAAVQGSIPSQWQPKVFEYMAAASGEGVDEDAETVAGAEVAPADAQPTESPSL